MRRSKADPIAFADKLAAQRANEFWIGWFADPIYLTGDYPASMREQLGDRLPVFTEEEKKLVLGSSDFYGMNTYTTNLIKNKSTPPALDDFSGNVEFLDKDAEGKPIGTPSECGWHRDVAWGFRKLLNWTYKRYGLPIVVTENGFPVKGESDLTPGSSRLGPSSTPAPTDSVDLQRKPSRTLRASSSSRVTSRTWSSPSRRMASTFAATWPGRESS